MKSFSRAETAGSRWAPAHGEKWQGQESGPFIQGATVARSGILGHLGRLRQLQDDDPPGLVIPDRMPEAKFNHIGFSLLAISIFLCPNATAASPSDFDGTVRLPGCSGAIVQVTDDMGSKALMLSNGHCVSQEKADTFSVDKPPINRNLIAFSSSGAAVPITAIRMLYASMTDTDLGLVELEQTYADLLKKRVHPFKIASESAPVGTIVRMPSTFFKTVEECKIAIIAVNLREDHFHWVHSYGYDGCHSIKNTSGSPLIGLTSRRIVGLNNTRNVAGKRCALDNPCEVDAKGAITVVPDRSYGQQVYPLLACFGGNGKFDLSLKSCDLYGHQK
jgi:hypothetical protein